MKANTTRSFALTVLAVSISVAATGVSRAQETTTSIPAKNAGTDADRLGWHTVRPGDTLEIITELYLGTSILWQENWKLNEDLRDPNLLRVGERLRVILERQLPPRVAEVTLLSNRVEQKPQPQPWTEARVGSLLKERDGVRTYEASSAKLRFDDDNELVVTEDSIVFLTEMTAHVSGTKREIVEIVEGQAELETRQASRRPSEIEIVVGDARTRPSVGPTGVARTRARKPNAGGAAVMVFGGQAEVSSGGASVDVPTGMGTAVPEGGAPAPPEPLLPAPAATSPADSSSWDYANPAFTWEAVDGAVSYVIEICADQDCAELVERMDAIEQTRFLPNALPVGALFWRVSGVSASGLDGFPSNARALTIASARLDRLPPVVAGLVRGLGYVDPSGNIWLGQGGGVVLSSHDDASGVRRLEYRWDDGGWLDYSADAIRPPDGGSTRTLHVRATDGLGRESAAWSVPVGLDDSAPEPPTAVGEAPTERR